MLSAARFENYKILRKIEIPLSPFTVVIGPNGVGKSSTLDGIFSLLQFCAEDRENYWPRVRKYFQDENEPNLLSSPADNLTIEVQEEGEDLFGLHLQISAEEQRWEVLFRRVYRGQERKSGIQGENFLAAPDLRPFASVMRLGLDARAIAQPSPAAKGTPVLTEEGGGLPTVLVYLAKLRDGSLERIEQAMASLIPGFQRIELEETVVERTATEEITIEGQALPYERRIEEPGFRLEVVFEGVGRVPAFHLSEGTLILLALLTLLHSPIRPRLLLLDDLDRALHPKAQVELVELLRKLVEMTPDFQIIATAHSPLIVSRCARSEVVVLKRQVDGSTGLAAPEEAPGILNLSELLHSYFSLTDTIGASELLQEYGLYASDARRSEAEEQRVQELVKQLREMGVAPPFAPVARRGA